MKSTPPRQMSSRIIRELAPYMSLGTQLTFTVIAFAVIGWWIDERQATQPLWTAVFTGCGALIGLTNMIRSLIRFSKAGTNSTSGQSTVSNEEK